MLCAFFFHLVPVQSIIENRAALPLNTFLVFFISSHTVSHGLFIMFALINLHRVPINLVSLKLCHSSLCACFVLFDFWIFRHHHHCRCRHHHHHRHRREMVLYKQIFENKMTKKIIYLVYLKVFVRFHHPLSFLIFLFILLHYFLVGFFYFAPE